MIFLKTLKILGNKSEKLFLFNFKAESRKPSGVIPLTGDSVVEIIIGPGSYGIKRMPRVIIAKLLLYRRSTILLFDSK